MKFEHAWKQMFKWKSRLQKERRNKLVVKHLLRLEIIHKGLDKF
jgi:hypothetical protein